MEIKNKLAALTILTAFNFANVQAASVDAELAVIAAEQAQESSQETTPAQSETPAQETRSRREIKAEERRLKEEQKAAEKQRKEEMKAAEKEIREAQKRSKDEDRQQLRNNQRPSQQENFPAIDPVTTPVEPAPVETPAENISETNGVTTFEPPQNSTPVESPTPSQNPTPPQNSTPVESPTLPQNPAPPQNSTPVESPTLPQNPAPPQNSTPVETPAPPVGLPNPIIMQASFEDLVEAVHFTPLYMPKKSGFSINSMMSIDGRTAEIRYGRRWEPEVSLHVRTYKRLAGEETRDISGVNGVRWRVDVTSGTTVYIAKISESKHVAAWAVGNYTFSAQAENLSFAAFHAIVAEELVDLSLHYYVN